MALVLVVHNPFSVNGTDYAVGSIVALADLSAVQSNPLLYRYCNWADHTDAPVGE